MRKRTITALVALTTLCLMSGCGLRTGDDDAGQVDDGTTWADEAAVQYGISSEPTSSELDQLSGRWNIRPDLSDVWYFSAATAVYSSGVAGATAGGVASPSAVLDSLCENHDLCVNTAMAVDFELQASYQYSADYTLTTDGVDATSNGILLHRRGVAVFNVGAGWVVYDGVSANGVGGAASQMGITPTRPEIDTNFTGPYDGVFVIEIAAAANIANMVIPAGGIVIAVPFDAVNCDLHAVDCVK